MIGKNNRYLKLTKEGTKVESYSIKKFKVGAASVVIGASIFFGAGAVAQASEEVSNNTTADNTTNAREKAEVPTAPTAPAATAKPVAKDTTKEDVSAAVAAKAGEKAALDTTKLEKYIAEIQAKLDNGTYANKTEDSIAVLKADLEAAKATLANATTQKELTQAYGKLVTTVNAKLKTKPVEKKETPEEVDTTNGKQTVGKKAENTEKKSESNSIENTGSHDSRNGKALDKNNVFRAETAAAAHEVTTKNIGNLSYTIEFSDDAKKEIYVYNKEEANIEITVNSTNGRIKEALVKQSGNRDFIATTDPSVVEDGFGWSYHQIVSETDGPVTVRVTGQPNQAFMALPRYNKEAEQHGELGTRFLSITNSNGEKTVTTGGDMNQPGYFKIYVESQTKKYDVKDLTGATRITVNDIDNITATDLSTIKSRLQLEYSKTNNDARLLSVRGTAVNNPTQVIDTVAVSTTEPSKLVVTYKDGSTDTIEKSKVLNVKPKGIIPFSNPSTKEIYVYKGEETNLEFGVTDDSGKIKDLRIVQGSANINNSGAARGQVRDEYGLTMTSETNENGIAATTANPAITRITGTVSVPGKPNYVGPLMTRYLVAEDLDGAIFSYPDANKNMDQEGAFKLVVREQTQKFDVQLQGAESNKIAVADVNNLSTEDFEKIKNNIKIKYNTADDARLKDKDGTRHGTLVENASQYIQSITNAGNNIVVTYKDGSTDTIEKTAVLRSAPGPVVTRTQSRKSVLSEDGVLSTDRTLKGTGTPGATIKVSVKDEQDPTQLRTLYDNVTVGTDGNWSVDLTHGLYSNITDQTQLYPREPLSVTQTVNGLESVETVVPVALGDSKVLPSEASKDGASVVAGSNKLVVKVPHDAGIAYVDYKNKETDARSELAFKRENKDSQWTMKDASKATITSVTSDGFYDTVTLEMKEKIKEGTPVRVISNIYDGKYSSPVDWVSTPVSNEKPTLASTNGQTETTVNVGDTVNPVDLVTAADHEDDKNATLGTKGTTEVVSVNGDETVKTIDTTTAGSYVVKYKVVDSQGKESDVLTHTVIVNLNKQPAIDAVTQAATAQIEKINGNKAATKEEKDAAIAKVNNDKQAAIDAINAGTVKTQDALTKAQNAGTTAISNDNPETSVKTNAKNAIDQDLASKISAIEGRQDLSEAEKQAAKDKATEKATAAKTAIENATTTAEVNTAKGDGTTAIDNVTPVAKTAAKQAIADALNGKDGQKGKLQEIEERTDLTTEEKAAAKKEAQDKADAELAKINAQPDAADTPDAATTAQKAVDAAGTKGAADVKSVNPTAVKKPEAKVAVEAARKAKEDAIKADPNLTQAEKDAAIAKNNKAAEDATKAIDAATTDTAVEQAKTAGTGEIAKVNPVAKEKAKEAIATALTAKNGEIDKRIDLTDEEKAAAKEDAKAKADAELAKINAQPDNAETADAATAAQTAVDAAKKTGVDEVTAVNPTAVTKPAAKKAIEDKLAEQLETIANTPDATDEEKKVAADAAKAAAEKAKAEVDKATTDAAVKAEKDKAVGEGDTKGTIDQAVPVVEDKPNARKAIEDETKAKKAEIDARTDLTPAAKEALKAKVDKVAKKAKEGIDAVTSKADVDVIKEADKSAIKAIGEVNRPIDKVLVKDPSALTAEEKAKILEEVKKVNPTAKEVKYDDNGKIEVTTEAGDKGIIKPTKLVKTEDQLDNGKGGNDINKPLDRVIVKDPAELTDKEKAKIVAKVEEVNPDAIVTIDENGTVSVSTPDGKTAAIPASELVRIQADVAKAGAGNSSIVKPADKVFGEANDPDDQAKVEQKLRELNPETKSVKFDENGNATVTLKDGTTATIPSEDLFRSEADTTKPNAGNDIVKPADKVVVDPAKGVDEAAKKAIEDKVKAVNPGATVVVDDKGNATVTTPEGKTAVILAADLTKSPEEAAKPNAGNDIVKPADKTVVANPDSLTKDEKDAIVAKVKAVNPGAEVVVDDKGNATVTLENGNTAVIPAADLTKSPEEAAKPNAGNDIVKPADKTVVANPDSLTKEEKEAIVAKVKAVNPGAEVVVDDKGNATVTVNGKTAVIPATDLTKTAEEPAKPNAGNDIVKAADKTVVANPDILTPDEKKAIAAKVKAVNPGAEVVVDDKGNATVTVNGKTAVIPATDLTKKATDETKPNAGNDIVKPASKTKVANLEQLTDAEKKAIEDKVKAVNPGATVVVDDKGNATVTLPNGNTAVIPASDLTKSEKDVKDGKAKDNAVTPAAKTKVANPEKLTDAEKKAIEDKVKAANPGATVVVDNKGNATVVKDGNVSVIPASDLVKVEDDAKKDNGGNDANTPAAKTVVRNPESLTKDEKDEIIAKVKAVNPGAEVVVDDKGNATVTKADGTVLNIPSTDLVIPADNLANEAKNAKVKTPAFRTLVADKANLTKDEKEAVKKAIESVNPGATVVVDDKGNATVTLDGNTVTIAKEQLVKTKDDVKAKNSGDNINLDFDKVLVKDLKNISKEDKVKFQFMILGAITDVPEFDINSLNIEIDAEGNATVTLPDGTELMVKVDESGNTVIKSNDGKTELVINFDEKGNATVVTKDGQVLAIPAEIIFKEKVVPKLPERVKVADKANLTPEEREAVKKAIETANPGTTAVVDEKGNVKVTYGDGTVVEIPAADLVVEKSTNPETQNGANVPANRVLVTDKENLTPEELAAIKESVQAVNPGAKVVVDAKGNATVTTIDGLTVTIPSDQLVKTLVDVLDKNDGNNINLDFAKQEVADFSNITDEEKAAAKAKIIAANPNVKDIIFDAKGNATVILENGKAYTILAKDIFSQKGAATLPKSPEREAGVEGDKSTNSNAQGVNEKLGQRLANTGTTETNTGLAGLGLGILGGLLAAARRRKEK